MQWDVFCRVIDNFGDIGVCWRLCADLAARGETVRLWADDASACAWMAPAGAPGVTVHPWPEGPVDAVPGDVVIEAFGCELPADFVERMTRCAPPPVWLNLEYLSAEGYVARSHGLASPQRNGLTKWFFYPGFTPDTGGLLREADALARMSLNDDTDGLRTLGIEPEPGERLVSLFCYENASLPMFVQALSRQPTLLLLSGTQSQWQVARLLGGERHFGRLRVQALPLLPQHAYDDLLRRCDLNFVRGEDSFVRAQWAGRPFLWQIYPQHDGAHVAKLDAFVDGHLRDTPAALADPLRALFHRWNASAPPQAFDWPALPGWSDHAVAWREHLLQQTDLTSNLLRFARTRVENAGGRG